MELRQLRYFVALAEELHFGRAAARVHIGQSALSQQLQNLEQELGTRLLDRDTQGAELTDAGEVLLPEARRILAHVERARKAVTRTAETRPLLHVGASDPSYDSTSTILRRVRQQHPEIGIHHYEAGLPELTDMLLAGRLDVAFGRVTAPDAALASELVRYDQLGVLINAGHKLAVLPQVPLAVLADVPLLLAHENRAPEYNDFLREMFRAADISPRWYNGSISSLISISAQELIVQHDCWICAPASCARWLTGVAWRPLTEPVVRYPLSVVWRSGDDSHQVRAIIAAALAVAKERHWRRE